ncbi:MAG: PD-(D/E)XK nuclease family protein [Acidobacteriota bacterium]
MRRPLAVEEIARHLYPVRGEGGGPGAARIGIEAHGLVAADRQGPFFEDEVPIEAERVVDGREVRITGRIDGIERTLMGDVVFEVKTYAAPPDDVAELVARFPHHVFQLRTYGLLRDAAELRLVAVPIGSDGYPDLARVREIVVPPADISADLDLAIASLVDLRRRQARRHRQRPRIPIEAPFATWRAHQEGIQAFLGRTSRAAVVAATGSGKTAPALVAALERSLARGQRLYWATARTSGQPPIVETARRMRERGARGLRALRLTAQDRLCPYASGICPDLLNHRRHVWEGEGPPPAARRSSRSGISLRWRRNTACARGRSRTSSTTSSTSWSATTTSFSIPGPSPAT